MFSYGIYAIELCYHQELGLLLEFQLIRKLQELYRAQEKELTDQINLRDDEIANLKNENYDLANKVIVKCMI